MKFYLLDSRAGGLALNNKGILDTDDNGKYIILVGTVKEMCKDANSGDYGDNCVVCDENYNILWHCVNHNGHWVHKKHKENESKS